MLRFALVLMAAMAAVGFARMAPAAESLSSQNCAAIAFHPVAPGTADGEQEAGYYKSRLGQEPRGQPILHLARRCGTGAGSHRIAAAGCRVRQRQAAGAAAPSR